MMAATGGWEVDADGLSYFALRPTGAGDTIVGTLALALATGASIRDGAVLANRAAGLVVGMVGTGTVTAQQLSEALTHG